MKHLLPKPKSQKAKPSEPSEPSQPELQMEEQPPPLAPEADVSPDASPIPSSSDSPVNHVPDPAASSVMDMPPSPPMSVENADAGTSEETSSEAVPFSFLSGHENASALEAPVLEPVTAHPPEQLEPGPADAASTTEIADSPSPVEAPNPEPIQETVSPESKKTPARPPPLPIRVLQKKRPPPLPQPATQLATVLQPGTAHPSTSVRETRHQTPQPAPLAGPAAIPVDGHFPFLIQTRGLVKQYGGRRVVNGVDIYVKPGEVVGLLGKNGAGKTTTFYMIVGLVTPTEGHVYMGDEDVTRMPMYRRARRGIGYLPQEESIFRKLTVEENLLAILETLPMTEEERDVRCDDLLRDFGLEHVRENVAITLSGGEKRRVTIARALVTSPTLLLLDEPFSGVDPMAVHDIQEIILSLKRRGLGVLITDHNVRETLSVVDRAYIIDEGRVLSEGSREFLLNDPIAREIYLGHRFSM